jgi:hypothetical protein
MIHGMVDFRKTQPAGQMEKYSQVTGDIDAIISSEGRRLFPCCSNSRITNSTSIRLQWSTTSLPRAIRRKVLYYDTGHDLNDPKALEDRYDWLVKFINLRREPSSSPVRSPSRGANRRACGWGARSANVNSSVEGHEGREAL